MTTKQAPRYFRDWERFPSGQVFERVTRRSLRGECASIAKTTHIEGLAEYAFTHSPQLAENFSEYDARTFGRQTCNEKDFEILRKELIRALQDLSYDDPKDPSDR